TSFIAWARQLIAPSIVRATSEAELFARILITIGAVFVFASATLRTWAAAYLQTAIVHDSQQHSEVLVADGPFRYTRNPLYLASLPMAAGIGVLASRAGFIFLVLANWIFLYRLIFREEKALRQNQGESYRAYFEAVPRFWPALRPRVSASGRSPRWAQAFAGESFVWIFGLAELSIAITLNPRVGLIAFVFAFFAYRLPLRLVQREHARRKAG
ncbi:MAG TPA: isoprenylcysteine carboxylmethyltransferase family protein, partial [Chthoniobacterales bacterium]|nr:isoprenylcysteine carboxylmethyltransferase family protein [Chthoniobacterales bacterium]